MDDMFALGMYERFKEQGYCPFGSPNELIGFLRDAKETKEGYVFMVEITNPKAIEYLVQMEKRVDHDQLDMRGNRITKWSPASVEDI